jgi:Fe2+ or Zn2+ uptake regulation protein
MIMQVLEAAQAPMAAEDVIRTLIEWGARVGIGTVYRVPAEVLQRA